MPCEFAINGNCQISTEMAGIPVPLHDGACRACLARPDAKQIGNHVVTDRACYILVQAGQRKKAEALRAAEIGLKKLTPKQIERKRRVREASAKQERLISWLQLARQPIGDLVVRLLEQKSKTKTGKVNDARAALERLLQQCSCSQVDAVNRLNQRWPY